MVKKKSLTIEEELASKKASRNAKKKKTSSSENTASIFDEDILKKRKEQAEQVKASRQAAAKTKTPDKPKEPQWWQKPISFEEFIIKECDSKFYARLPIWKKSIWIGAYSSKNELEVVLQDYCKLTSSKKKKKREVKNLHSVIIEIDD